MVPAGMVVIVLVPVAEIPSMVLEPSDSVLVSEALESGVVREDLGLPSTAKVRWARTRMVWSKLTRTICGVIRRSVQSW